jgi:hypothetical protein
VNPGPSLPAGARAYIRRTATVDPDIRPVRCVDGNRSR